MKPTDAWMPLYIGDYLADTGDLTTEEHGAYLLLLMAYWRHGPLQNRRSSLANFARVERRKFDKIWLAIGRFFHVHEDGMLHNKRADQEIEEARQISEARRQAGREGGKKKAANCAKNDPSKRLANAWQNATPSQSQRQSIQNRGNYSDRSDLLIEADGSESKPVPLVLEAPAPTAPAGDSPADSARVAALVGATAKGMAKMEISPTEQQKVFAWIHRTQHNSAAIVEALARGLMEPAGSRRRTDAMNAMEKFIQARRAEEGRKPRRRAPEAGR